MGSDEIWIYFERWMMGIISDRVACYILELMDGAD